MTQRSDLAGGAGWMVFGLVILAAAWRMDRFDQMGATIYTAPGLVPGFYGAIIVLLSIWLAVRAVRQGALQPRAKEPAGSTPKATSDVRLALAVALGLVFVVGLIGRVPFWLASAIFVASFTTLFEWQPTHPWPVRARRIGEAVLLGLATGVAVTLVFEKVFYVRLP